MGRIRRLLPALLALCLLTGCASLLEGRSYSVVEPYTDRYWDPAAEDTMRAETYQDLVNSLLLLLDQRSEKGTIRYYGDEDSFLVADAARSEVCQDTVAGAYLIDHMPFLMDWQEDYTVYTFTLVYRKDAEDMDDLMAISDSQSLADLLRLALREGLARLAVSFPHETVSREEIEAVVDQQWQEMYLEYAAPEPEPLPQPPEGEPVPEEAPPQEADESAESVEAAEAGEAGEMDGQETEPPADGETPPPPQPQVPPCPWTIRFYPDVTYPGIVEIRLTGGADMFSAAG